MARARRARSKVERPLAVSLARVGDPLVLPDGTVIDPTPAGEDFVEPKSDLKPAKVRATKKRSISELPADANVLNGIACVFMYTLLGVGDREIAEALRVTVPDVKAVRNHPAYNDCFDMIKDEFVNVNSDMIHARIAAYANGAISKVAHIAQHGKKEANVLRANIDILDRGGITKKQDSARGNVDALRIVVTNGDQSTEVSIGGREILPS